MRQTHAAGEKLFVDFAGDTVPVFDAATGMERRAHIFVAVLGASNYTYAEARWTRGARRLDRRARQRLRCHRRRAEGGGLRQPQGRRHRGLPLRARHQPHLPGAGRRTTTPRSCRRASAEAARQGQGRSGRANRPALRAGAAAQPALLLARSSSMPRSARSSPISTPRSCASSASAGDELLETIDRPALKALPSEPYQYAEWKKCRVAPDYHVEIAGHYYSVPSRLIREQVEARITDTHDRDLPQGRARCEPCAARTCVIGTRRSPSTCRARTGATPSGRRRG